MAISSTNLTSLHSFIDTLKASEENLDRHSVIEGAIYEVQGRLNQAGLEYEDWDEMKSAAETYYDL